MRRALSLIGILTLVGITACQAGKGGKNGPGGKGGTGGQGTGTDNGTTTAAATTTTGQGGGGDGGLFETGGGPAGPGSGGGVPNCDSGPNDDADKDGFTPAGGDCNDCDANVNPGAVEVLTAKGGMTSSSSSTGGGEPGVPVDENCNGLVDDQDPDLIPCDGGLSIAGPAMDGARAIELCKQAVKPKEWGVISATWVLADGTPSNGNPNFDLGHGILTAFGPNVNVQKGIHMLGVSSGSARQPTDPGYQNVGGFSKGYGCTHPPGFPKESPSCGVAVTGNCYDSTGLEVKVRVPTNAHGFSFNFNFFTYEWPGFVCTTFNDFFTAILSPKPAGLPDGNITFDNLGNPVSVNNAFVQVCGCAGGPPCQAGGKKFDCALGDLGLFGTGFGPDSAGSDHGSTSWLITTAPVEPGTEISLRFVAYDSGDGILDSTGLVDNFAWIAEPGTPVGTNPIPDPK